MKVFGDDGEDPYDIDPRHPRPFGWWEVEKLAMALICAAALVLVLARFFPGSAP